MSASAWHRVTPGETVTVRNRFIRISRTVTVESTLLDPSRGFVDTDGQTFTPDGYELAVGTTTVEQTARSILHLLASARTSPQHREELSC